MKHSYLHPPKISHILLRVVLIFFPMMILTLCTAFLLMYRIDQSTFQHAIENEVQSLVAIANTYDGVDYTKRDLFYSRMKDALLAYSERNALYDTYAVIINHDKIIHASTKASIRAYILQSDSDYGLDYYCEEETVLNWMTNGDYQNPPDSEMQLSSIDFLIEDAWLLDHSLFLPGKMYRSIHYVKIDSESKQRIDDSFDLKEEDFSGLTDNIYHAVNINTTGAGYHIILDDQIRGTHSTDKVFKYVNERCERQDTPLTLGTVESYHQIKLDHGSDSLILFASMNVFEAYFPRYIMVFLFIILLFILSGVATVLTLYVTEKKKYEENAFQTTLINRLSHDLRTPITAMMGYSENLLYNLNTEKKEHYTKAIQKNAEYMNEIIQNVLLFSRTESPEIKLQKTTVNLIALTKSAWEKYSLMSIEKDINIEYIGDCRVNADATLMHQMIENLISNACKYALPNSTIRVTGEAGSYKISNACEMGFSKNAEELWKPFVKGEDSRSNRKGTGIGLSIVKNICDLHHFKTSLSCDNGSFNITITFI